MRKNPSSLMAVLATLMLILAACSDGGGSSASPGSEAPSESAAESVAPSESAAASVDYKACMVSDIGGIDDNSFNENAWKGMEDAAADFGVEVTFLESRGPGGLRAQHRPAHQRRLRHDRDRGLPAR